MPTNTPEIIYVADAALYKNTYTKVERVFLGGIFKFTKEIKLKSKTLQKELHVFFEEENVKLFINGVEYPPVTETK